MYTNKCRGKQKQKKKITKHSGSYIQKHDMASVQGGNFLSNAKTDSFRHSGPLRTSNQHKSTPLTINKTCSHGNDHAVSKSLEIWAKGAWVEMFQMWIGQEWEPTVVWSHTWFTHACASCATRRAHGKFEMAKLKALSRRRRAVRLFRSWVSERNNSLGCWRASRFLSPLSCHLSTFCWAVNRLPYIWNRSGVFYPPGPRLRPPFIMASWAARAKGRYVNYS